MKKYMLVKIGIVLMCLAASWSCRNVTVNPVPGSINDSYYNFDGLVPKSWEVTYASSISKSKGAAAANASVTNDYRHHKDQHHFRTENVRNDLAPGSNSLENYAEINRINQKTNFKVRAWIICKPQFIRVHSEGFYQANNRIENLF